MYSLLIVALFAVLSLTVHASPVPCNHTPSPTPTGNTIPTSSGNTTPSTTPSVSPSSTSSAAPPPATAPASDASSGAFTGGVATFFYQGGNPGACGWYNPDSAIICALDQARYDSSLCGRQVQITNLDNNWSLNVTIADDCPTCGGSNSIDLSVGAFQALGADLSLGEFPISWYFLP